MIIDTHCHYNLDPLYSENGGWQARWQEAQAAGVQSSIVVGTSAETSQIALEIARTDSNLFAAVGIHPGEVGEPSEPVATQLEKVTELLKNKPQQLVAVGEFGLDYYHYQQTSSATEDWQHLKLAQLALARQQLVLASQAHLPALLHVRSTDDSAYWDMLELLKDAHLTAPFVLHCASGPLSYITSALELGAYVSIAGNVTYKNAENIRAIVAVVPPDRLLVETDAPYLPPVPHRGSICQPAMIQLTVEYLQNTLGVKPEQLLHNARQLFSV